LPISYNQVSKTNIGLGLRLGPLTFGSSSAISNLMKTAHELNLFVGLRFGHMAYPNN
jgi:putative outer membrane protein, ompA family